MPRISRWKPFLVIAICVLACATVSAQAPPAAYEKPSLRVLFIGNSYTYFNNLPEMLAKLADAGHQKKIIYEMQAPGGLRLKDHWSRAETRQALSSEKWP